MKTTAKLISLMPGYEFYYYEISFSQLHKNVKGMIPRKGAISNPREYLDAMIAGYNSRPDDCGSSSYMITERPVEEYTQGWSSDKIKEFAAESIV